MMAVAAVLFYPPGNMDLEYSIWSEVCVEDDLPIGVKKLEVLLTEGLHDSAAIGQVVVSNCPLCHLSILGKAKAGIATEDK